MRKITTTMLEIWNDESGISSVEYALLLSFVATGIIFGRLIPLSQVSLV